MFLSPQVFKSLIIRKKILLQSKLTSLTEVHAVRLNYSGVTNTHKARDRGPDSELINFSGGKKVLKEAS